MPEDYKLPEIPEYVNLYSLKNDAMGKMYDSRNKNHFTFKEGWLRRSAAWTILYRSLEAATIYYEIDEVDSYMWEESRKHPRLVKMACEQLTELLEAYE